MSSGLQVGTTVDSVAQMALLRQTPSAEIRGQLRIGEISIQVVGSRRTDVSFDLEQERFRITPGPADIDIEVSWVESLAPTRGRVVFDSGTTWRLYQREDAFQFDFLALGVPYRRLFVDQSFHRATLEMSAVYFKEFPHLAGPLAYPLDELLIMHRLTQEKAIELHGCGIVRQDGTGNLFVGHSGAGKSTTTRLWTAREDVEVLSDDRIIVRRDEGREARDETTAETSFRGADDTSEIGILRLRDRSASLHGHFAQDDRAIKQVPHRAFGPVRNDKGKMRMYGTPWHGEAMYASPGSAGLTRIFVLEHGRGNVISRLPPSQAVAELFARSFVPFHRHEYVDSALEFLQELVETVPCYRYSFEPDERAVEKILEFRD
jgi:hypothetical protein